jgi:hypothetical protein
MGTPAKVSKETLELASMALNAKIAELDGKYSEGTSGYALRQRYVNALYEVNDALRT